MSPLATHLCRKLQPINHIKNKCLSATKVSIDEKMVKDKDRCHYKQYIKSKPTVFKLYVLAIMKGYYTILLQH